MPDTPPPATTPVNVTPSATLPQIKGQVRILLAAFAGAMVGRHLIPADLVNDVTLDAVSALIMIGLASGWQWARGRLEHSRWWTLATDHRVPDDLVRVATPKE